MFNVTTKSLTWGDKELILETGKIARQADFASDASHAQADPPKSTENV